MASPDEYDDDDDLDDLDGDNNRNGDDGIDECDGIDKSTLSKVASNTVQRTKSSKGYCDGETLPGYVEINSNG